MTAVEVLAVKLVSPLYAAVTFLVPAVPKVAVQTGTDPFEAIVEVQSNRGVPEVVSEKVTVPVGKVKPLSETVGVTAAVKLTA